MDKVCRLCLHLEVNMTSIFYGNNVTSDLQLKIQDLCLLEVTENDVLPKMICASCKGKLSYIEEFRNQCKYSDYKLREFYKVSVPYTTNSSHSKTEQNVAVQTEEDSTSSNQSCSTMGRKYLWEDALPVADKKVNTDNDEDRKQASVSATNQTVSCRVKKNNVNLRKRTRVNFGRDTTLDGKIVTKPTKNREKFTCDWCQKVYISKRALLNHTQAHMKEEIVMCKVCNKAFNGHDKLIEHVKRHSNGMDFKCEVCDMPFKEQVKLNFHLRVHGKGPPINTEKQYSCDVCGKSFASKSGLRFHLKSHTGTKPYACKFCNKSFTIPSYKKRHERTHTGDKHFICHICNAGFASTNGLKYHLRLHTGEANYHCTTCGKSFRRLKYLKEHTFTHTGERPFICKICGSAYGNSGSLFVHEKKCKAQYALNNISPLKVKQTSEVHRA